MPENELFLSKLNELEKNNVLPSKYKEHIYTFYKTYKEALEKAGLPFKDYIHIFFTFLDLVKKQCEVPYKFEPFHKALRSPFDYYGFGIDFLKPLVDLEHSSLYGLENLKEIHRLVHNKENVILLANHQIEADPQAISIMLEKCYPTLGEEMIFVAGERVVTDPLAVPFSLGRNLLCIYSKRYIDHPPELKASKQLHNKKTMQLMSELLAEGGKCIYVAPSGGRDRRNKDGIVEVSPFDAQSIEMFYLMAKKASHPTHFFPLSLSTYDLMPPPSTVQIELGETRITNRGPIHISFGSKIDMENFSSEEIKDKHELRQKRAEFIWTLVKEEYKRITA